MEAFDLHCCRTIHEEKGRCSCKDKTGLIKVFCLVMVSQLILSGLVDDRRD